MERAGRNASASVSRIITKPRKHGTSYINVGHSSEVDPRPEGKHGRIYTQFLACFMFCFVFFYFASFY